MLGTDDLDVLTPDSGNKKQSINTAAHGGISSEGMNAGFTPTPSQQDEMLLLITSMCVI